MSLRLLIAIILAPILILGLLFSAPGSMYETVPLARVDQVEIYVEAASSVSASTSSPCDDGVTVNWKPMLAIDAVRLRQNFKKANYSDARELGKMFIEQTGT